MIKKLSKSGGFTLIEIIIVLAIIGMLAGILAPTLVKYVQSAKLRRATEDVKMVGSAIGNFYNDMGEWPIWQTGTLTKAGDPAFKVLKMDGSTAAGDPDFDTSITDWPSLASVGTDVDTLENQLGTNVPAYPTSGKYAWRGPYIEQFREDPWKQRYLVNVEWIQPLNEQGVKPCYVISAGPNKKIETAYSQTGPGMSIGGDDIVFRIK